MNDPAPYSTKDQLLGLAYCHENKYGYPVWTQEQLNSIRHYYDEPPKTGSLCEHYTKTLPKLCMNDYTFSHIIGEGDGGSVYRLCIKDNCNYVGKFIKIIDDDVMALYQNEVAIMQKLTQAGLAVPLIDSWTCKVPVLNALKNKIEEKTMGVIIMASAGPSLKDAINDLKKQGKNEELLGLLGHVTLNINLMNNMGIMHRDLHTDNIMMYADKPLFIDFGLSYDKESDDLTAGEDNYSDEIPEGWVDGYDLELFYQSLKMHHGINRG
jgi:serine/threonine protein kinase